MLRISFLGEQVTLDFFSLIIIHKILHKFVSCLNVLDATPVSTLTDMNIAMQIASMGTYKMRVLL